MHKSSLKWPNRQIDSCLICRISRRIQWCQNFADRIKTGRAVQGLLCVTLEKTQKSWDKRILVQVKTFKWTNNWLIWIQNLSLHCIEMEFSNYTTFLLRPFTYQQRISAKNSRKNVKSRAQNPFKIVKSANK